MSLRAVVVGGGVIGLACARALDERGVEATVFEGSRETREASWAAAGILGAGSESVSDTPLFRLAREALALWPEVLADLSRETGIDVAFRDDGTLYLALDDHDQEEVASRGKFLGGTGFPSAVLTAAEARAKEPAISPDVRGALWIGEARLDNRAQWRAYEASCAERGVRIRRGETVTSLADDGGTVVGVRAGNRTVLADAVVLASGAWSETLARTAGLWLPMVPVKGQMVRLAAPDGLVRHVVKRGITYAVPQAGQGVVIGTTAETAGFDRSLSEDALHAIVANASRLVPAFASHPRTEAWSGFRPRLPDLLPAIGPVAARRGLFLATGHFRNGILLAEVTARMVADAILGRADPRLAAFSPDRFAPKA